MHLEFRGFGCLDAKLVHDVPLERPKLGVAFALFFMISMNGNVNNGASGRARR